VNWLVKNWSAKLVSLILAVGLWYYAVGEEGVEVARSIPVEIKVEQENMRVVGKPVRVVIATLQAPRALLANLASGELKAEHVIKKVPSPGDYSFRLEPSEIQLPSEKIRVVKIEPEALVVKIDEIIVQKLEVEPAFLGEPAIGYHLDLSKVQLDPRSVLVEGPKIQLEKLGKIKTQPIDVVGRTRSFRKTVRLMEDPGLKLLSESWVDAYVPVEEAAAEKTFEKVPVRTLSKVGLGAAVSVVPAELTVTLRGPAKNLEMVEVKDLLIYAEISDLAEGTHEVPVQNVLPELTALKEPLPSVKVTLSRKAA